MKLYATVTSERASKGQGGNEYIKISLQGKDGQMLGSIILTHNDALDTYFIRYVSNRYGEFVIKGIKGIKGIKQSKGKKQKDVCYCDESGLSVPHMAQDH